MTLEELIGTQAMQEQAGSGFSIVPNIKYEREEFVKRAKALFKLEGYYNALAQNSGDVSALNDLVGILAPYLPGDDIANREQIDQMLQNPNLALERAESILSNSYVAMGRFVERNRNKIMDKLDERGLFGVFVRVPLYKTGEKGHDRIVDLREKIMQIQQAAEKGGDISEIINSEIKELMEKVPDEQKPYIYKNQHLVIPILARSIVRAIQKAFNSSFRDKDGKINKGSLRAFLERNYKVAEDYIKDEIPSANTEEKFAYWDKNLKVQYVELARALYKPEKEAYEQDKKGKEKEREALAESKGLTVP